MLQKYCTQHRNVYQAHHELPVSHRVKEEAANAYTQTDIDSEVHSEVAHLNFSALSWRVLDPTKLEYNPWWPDGQLKLTVSAFNRLQPVCQQSWLQGLQLRRTRRFFHRGGRNHPCAWRDGQTKWAMRAWINSGKVDQRCWPQIGIMTGLHFVEATNAVATMRQLPLFVESLRAIWQISTRYPSWIWGTKRREKV